MFARVILVLAAGVGLSACQPAVPDSGAPNPGRGVGFDSAAAQQNAALARSTAVPAPSQVASAPLSSAPPAGSAAATAAETSRVLAATSAATTANGTGGVGTSAATNSGTEPLNASPSNPAPSVVNSEGISNENNFEAVSALRDIQTDARRIDENRAQYRLVQPQAVPDRVASGPNVVAYALANTHPVGTSKFRRGAFNTPARSARKCMQFSRPIEAQIAFLEAGGPKKDRGGLDPDGDGYACKWDPAPFRNANQPVPQQVIPAVDGDTIQISTE